MATIENLVKTKKQKELSGDLLKEFNSKQNANIYAVNAVKDIFDVVDDVLCKKSFDIGGDTDEDRRYTLKTIGGLQEEIYKNIFRKYKLEINSYCDYIKQLKKDNYNIPEIDNVYELEFKKVNDVIFKSSTGYYGRSYTFNMNQTKLVHNNLLKLFNSISLFDYSNVESVMESLGFVIMPYEFLSKEAYKVDKKYSTSTINDKCNMFINTVKELYNDSYDIYVLAPIKFLDLMKWAKCKDINKKVSFAKSLANISLTINMNMPLFRSIFDTLEVLNNKVDNVEKRVDKLENKVESIEVKLKFVESNISILQEQLSTLKTEMQDKVDKLIAENKSQNVRIASLEAWRIACETDPYIFAKSKTSNDCLSGFAWGPEFTQEVVKSLGISTYSVSHKDFKDICLN